MNPKIISVIEGRAVDAVGRVSTVLNVKWTFGTYGPFTLITNWADMNNGKALAAMRSAAAVLGTLTPS